MRILKEEKAQGLIEAVISLAIVGVVMVGVTLLTIRTMKIIKENEVEDVATQAMVEAMDYLKAPGVITVYINSNGHDDDYLHELSDMNTSGAFFRLNDEANEGYKLVPAEPPTTDFFTNADASCVDTGGVNYSQFQLTSLTDVDDERAGYNVCVQIYIWSRENVDEAGYEIYIVGAWDSPNGLKINKMNGFRSKEIRIAHTVSEGELQTCSVGSTQCIEKWHGDVQHIRGAQ